MKVLVVDREGGHWVRFVVTCVPVSLEKPHGIDYPLTLHGAAVLREGAFTRLSIANPQTAPYGAAGLEVLGALDLTQALTPKLVTGESIAQTLQFVETGNAELGFVALSQVIAAPAGAVWLVPETLHAPLAQDGVLLDPQAPAARAFLDYLRSAQAQAIMSRFGYQVP